MKFEDIAIRKVFKDKEHLCNQGCPVENLIKIVKGRCKTLRTEENGGMLMLGYYNSSGYVGDLEFFTGEELAFTTIIAVGEVESYSLPINKSREILRNDLDFIKELSFFLAKKFQESSLQNSENMLLSVEERLLAYLKFSFPRLKVTEKLCDIAMLLGTSYRQLLRCVKILVEKGYLEKRNGNYYLLK